MEDKTEEKNALIIIDLLSRISSLEQLLVSKGLVSKEEIIKHNEELNEKVFKSLEEKLKKDDTASSE